MSELDKFLEDRNLGEDKTTMLKYLEKVSDKISIEPRPKGRSLIRCHFDCGAYKGEEILTFHMQSLCPLKIAVNLMSLTSGHHFNFPDAKDVLLKGMNQ